MAGHGSQQPVDFFRKGLIVLMLLALVVVAFNVWDAPSSEFATVLMAVGFVVLASYTVGELAEVAKLPHITGYLVAGLLLGGSFAHTLADFESVKPWLIPPFDDGLLNEGVLEQLSLMDTLALALICLTAGGELKLESLRKGLARILAILGAQAVTIMTGITVFFLAISQPWSPYPFEPVAGLDLQQGIALGLVLASVGLATAPAATIAVMNSVGAKGPMTDNVLPVVVMKDVVVVVAFSAATAVAVGMMGAEGGGGFSAALLIIAASIALGALVGVGIHLYLRYVNAELLLFIVAMIFATAELATWMTHLIDPNGHPELALVFIAAGFMVANVPLSKEGDHLIHEVERLSLPVYVVFFTMAGAKLHISDLVASGLFAVLLVTVRIAMIWLGVRLGSMVPGTDDATKKYGWMGFISQAGLALTLAGSIKSTFGEGVGEGLFSLILAGVALNEIIGPVALQFGLGFAGETAAQRNEEATTTDAAAPDDSDDAPDDQLAPWRRQDADPDAWGPAASTASDELNTLTTELELELRQLVRDLDRGPLAEISEDAAAYLRGLRRHFLRMHRNLATGWSREPDVAGLPHLLRTEVALLAERWRDHLLARASSRERQTWSPVELQSAIDDMADAQPELIRAPIEPEVLAPREEPFAARLSRTWLRLRMRFGKVEREVQFRQLTRFHFRGRVAGRMEGLAALTVNAELHLAARTSALFDAIDDAAERLATLARSQDPNAVEAERIADALEAFRAEIEEDFRFALDEVGWVSKDAHVRATHILGSATKDLKEDLSRYDTPDLPVRKRRFSIVFNDRTRGLNALTDGLDAARATTASRYAALALVFEVVGLEAEVRDAVDAHADRLRRQIRGKAFTQIDRVQSGFDTLLESTDALLEPSERTGPELAEQLKQMVEPVAKVVEEAVDATTTLRDWLAGEASDTTLLDQILSAAQELSERYEVPVRAPLMGEWALPNPVPTSDIPFREVTVSFIEAHITRDVIDVTRRLSAQIDGLLANLQELQRVLQFNADLAVQELEVHTEVLGDESRQLVRDIVLGSWGRSQIRLETAVTAAQPLPDTVDTLLHDAVVAKLDTFRGQVLDGRITDLRHTLLRQVEVQKRFLDRAGSLSEVATAAAEQVAEGLAITLGDERIAALRYALGLPETVQVADPRAFAAPQPLSRLPTVYRRLFSDHALEAGDLLTGRDTEYAIALAALRSDRPGGFRNVALVGLDGIGRRALAGALVRGLGAGRVTRRTLTASVTVDDVDAWFDEEPGGLVLLEGLQHLFELRPGGFEPLRRFVRGLVEDAGRTAYLVLVDTPVWHFAVRATQLDSVFAEAVRMNPLTVEELETALISRHSMSGYGLTFESSRDLSWQVQDLLSRTDDTAERHQRTWFRTLHIASGGVLTDALRLWMASVRDVDEKNVTMRLGPVPMPPLARIRRLPEPTLLTLRQIASQGWTTAALHAGQFRIPEEEARAHLAALSHAGLIQPVARAAPAEGAAEAPRGSVPLRYRLPSHLHAPIVTVLQARGWFR
jgi:Kef-type K+ transport system membrane component KefB